MLAEHKQHEAPSTDRRLACMMFRAVHVCVHVIAFPFGHMAMIHWNICQGTT